MLGIYVHVPFCIKKCDYCDFFSIPLAGDPVPEEEYLRAIEGQLGRDVGRMGLGGREVGSVYFGGGTPSILSPDFFKRLIDKLRDTFSISDDAEISCEANPATAGQGWFHGMCDAGVTRISLGIQSFNREHLAMLGRVHSADDAMRSIAEAQGASFESVSLDLIYALPRQTMAELEDDLRTAMTFQPEHISAYQLTVEGETPLKRKIDDSLIVPLAEDESLKQMRVVARMLDRVRWRRYEISNFAKPGFECRHNLNYWNYGEYLGLGAGATSFVRTHDDNFGRRWTEARDVKSYLDGDAAAAEDELVDPKMAMSEFMFMSLRMTDGLKVDRFENLFGKNVEDIYGEIIGDLLKNGLMSRCDKSIKLTQKGLELSNLIFEKFMISRVIKGN